MEVVVQTTQFRFTHRSHNLHIHTEDGIEIWNEFMKYFHSEIDTVDFKFFSFGHLFSTNLNRTLEQKTLFQQGQNQPRK